MANFKDIGTSLGELVEKKNAAYGDATRITAEVMRKLFPNGVKPEQYEIFHYAEMIIHKLCRLATDPTAFGEDPVQDIAGYSILELGRVRKTEKSATQINVPVKGLEVKKGKGTPSCAKCLKSKKALHFAFCLPCCILENENIKQFDASWLHDAREENLAKQILASRSVSKKFNAEKLFSGLYQDETDKFEWRAGDHIPERSATLEVRAKYPGYWTADRGSSNKYWVVAKVNP